MYKFQSLHLDLLAHRSYETSPRLNGHDHDRDRAIQKPLIDVKINRIK